MKTIKRHPKGWPHVLISANKRTFASQALENIFVACSTALVGPHQLGLTQHN